MRDRDRDYSPQGMGCEWKLKQFALYILIIAGAIFVAWLDQQSKGG